MFFFLKMFHSIFIFFKSKNHERDFLRANNNYRTLSEQRPV